MRKIAFSFILLHIFFLGCTNKDNGTDVEIPEIVISVPTAGSVVADTIQIIAEFPANREQAEVSFFCDGDFIGMTYQIPYEIVWNTNNVTDNYHTLTCKVTMEDGESMSPEVEILVANTIFTVTITEDNFIIYDVVFILLSNEAGEIIDYHEFTSPQTYVFPVNPDIDYSQKINITHGFVNEYSDYSRLYTRNYIPLGRHWTLDISVIGLYSYPTLSFSNVPENQNYIISTGIGKKYSNDESLQPDEEYNFTGHADYPQLYLGLDCNGEYKYKWWDSCPSIPIDLSEMDIANTHNLSYTSYGTTADYTFRGFLDVDDLFSYFYLGTDNSLQLSGNLQLYYPPQIFEEFNTRLTLYDDLGDLYYYSYYGEIPDNLDYLSSDFDFYEINSTDFTIVPSGIFDIVYSYWFTDFSYWWINGPEDVYFQSLPDLPPELLDLLSVNSLDEWELGSVSICDYGTISSYDETWQILFESDENFNHVVNEYNTRTKLNPNVSRFKLAPQIISPDEFK